MSLESFLAYKTAEMIGFTLVGDFEFSSILVKNHSANRISKRHSLFYSLTAIILLSAFYG